ncbi:MAG TPA: response regulator transcription factor [Chthoniobacteraceae bacterium]|jgi:two-component system OmpR family response regulator|nr:response regulator transcription factor [Chthoniobacteraceae bacterium]
MRILIVEDEVDFLRTLSQAMREEGYAVDEAMDGEEGLYKAGETEYDAIVLDAMLPKFDGFELLRRLRRKKATPVLMLTARAMVRDRIRGLDCGADDYLGKPVDLNELSARIRALIRRSNGNPSPVVQIGELRADMGARTVTLREKAVPLSAREYALLEYLLQRRAKIVTRTQLYEHLHDENDTPLSNLVDVHVSNLRKKLGPDVIATHRGQGYSIGLDQA